MIILPLIEIKVLYPRPETMSEEEKELLTPVILKSIMIANYEKRFFN